LPVVAEAAIHCWSRLFQRSFDGRHEKRLDLFVARSLIDKPESESLAVIIQDTWEGSLNVHALAIDFQGEISQNDRVLRLVAGLIEPVEEAISVRC
jgi:hypothetical protein